ncbi:hypothetical protein COW64_21645 [bacterium (Candidatus Blackallbacteria) CG18_big_fil_WC_8_21_14_2_50_49_26]|nr:MAG: hypothetical protein COW64_21645 [bacterium (Candidatus Blackallbacteria) CG18_big_fil_WC_8_21_14_2_50_49_26]
MSDIYGINGKSLDEIKFELEKLLNIQFEDRYSDYLGGDYCLARSIPGDYSSSEMKIIKNLSDSPVNEGWYEDDFQEFEFILEIDDDFSPTPDEVFEIIFIQANDIKPLVRRILNKEKNDILIYRFINNKFELII